MKKDTTLHCGGNPKKSHIWVIDSDCTWQESCRWRTFKCGLCGKKGDCVYFDNAGNVLGTRINQYYPKKIKRWKVPTMWNDKPPLLPVHNHFLCQVSRSNCYLNN